MHTTRLTEVDEHQSYWIALHNGGFSGDVRLRRIQTRDIHERPKVVEEIKIPSKALRNLLGSMLHDFMEEFIERWKGL